MFCSYCGKEISDGSTFCQYCGKKMPVQERTTQQNATQQSTTQQNTPQPMSFYIVPITEAEMKEDIEHNSGMKGNNKASDNNDETPANAVSTHIA